MTQSFSVVSVHLRRMRSRMMALLAMLGTTGAMTVQGQFPFVHPGGMHTQADFDRMKAKVAANASPWVDSYNQMTTLWLANLNMPWAPVTQIIRGIPGSNYARSQKDALAIYYLALRWRITGDTNYAEEAIEGCDRWSSTMTQGVGALHTIADDRHPLRTGRDPVAAGRFATVKQGGPLLHLSFDNTNGTTVINGGSGGATPRFGSRTTVQFNSKLRAGGSHRRSVCVDYLYYSPDGTIQRVIHISEGTDLPPKDKTRDRTRTDW